MRKEAKRKIGEWLLDVSKYVCTAVLISSVFKDLETKWALYLAGFACVSITFILGLFMYNRNINK